jgi:hypothetical protein
MRTDHTSLHNPGATAPASAAVRIVIQVVVITNHYS